MTEPADSCRCDDVAADLVWVAEAVGAPVATHRHLVGGISSTVIRCEFAAGVDPLALRVLDDRELLAREPDIIEREAEALRILARQLSEVRAPSLVAAEYSPDVGRLLMTWVEGRMIVDTDGLHDVVSDLAGAAADIAATPLPDGHRLSPWRSWARPDPEPPTWGDHGLWREAIAVHCAQDSPTLDGGAVTLLHRDLHPLNVLWTDTPGVVDWVNACVGHPHAELAHCRWNLAVTAGFDVADRFVERYFELTADRGYGTYDRWWDVDSMLDKVPGPPGTAGWHAVGRTDITTHRVATITDSFLRAALADKG